jgi:hypothetical protein
MVTANLWEVSHLIHVERLQEARNRRLATLAAGAPPPLRSLQKMLSRMLHLFL